MQVTKTFKVTKCSECPHFSTTMDGPICDVLEKRDGSYQGLIYPEGRNKIPTRCPCNIW